MGAYPNQRKVIKRAARRHGIPARILWGLYGAESNFGRNKNDSSAGAQGPFQFMPATAASYGIDPHNFKQAANAAAKYLSTYEDRGVAGMLAAYNAGPAGSPSNPETAAYIPKVRELAESWRPPKGGNGDGNGGKPGRPGRPGTPDRTKTVTREDPAARKMALLQYLSDSENGDSSAALLSLAMGLRGATSTYTKTIPGKPAQKPERDGKRSTVRGKAGTGDVVVSPGANRAGVPLDKVTLNFLDRLSRIAKDEVVVGTGTNHSQYTVNGNVSDHWDGHGADIPASGQALTRLGRRALIAAGMPKAEAMKVKGGLFNLTFRGKRVQIIFNTDEGGNHWDHLHVGVR